MRFGDAMRMATSEDWIKPRYYEYLARRRDVPAEQKFALSLLGLPERDRTNSWAASGAGKCLRQRQFGYLGLSQRKPEQHSLNIFLNGTWTHIRHQVVGLAASYLRQVEVPLVNKKLNLRGTMDAIDITGIPVEYKSINQNGFMGVRQFGPRSDHLAQIHSYMYAGGFSSARMVYENKNTNDLLEFHVQRSDEQTEQVLGDLDMLNAATGAGVLLPMLDECTRKEGQYRWCPYASQCPMAGPEVFSTENLERSDTRPTSSSESGSPTSLSPPGSPKTGTAS